MNVVREERDSKNWLEKPHLIRYILTKEYPPLDQIGTSFGIVFHNEDLILANLSHRGIDLPGGHIEAGEHPDDALKRELVEEIGVEIGDFGLIGRQEINCLFKKPKDYKYSHPINNQLFYWAKAKKIDESFSGMLESNGRKIVNYKDAYNIDCIRNHIEFFNEARKAVGLL